jgi:hypothetical protein
LVNRTVQTMYCDFHTVYDVTRRETFDSLGEIWMQEVDMYRWAPSQGWRSIVSCRQNVVSCSHGLAKIGHDLSGCEQFAWLNFVGLSWCSTIDNAIKMVVANKVDRVRGHS